MAFVSYVFRRGRRGSREGQEFRTPPPPKNNLINRPWTPPPLSGKKVSVSFPPSLENNIFWTPPPTPEKCTEYVCKNDNSTLLKAPGNKNSFRSQSTTIYSRKTDKMYKVDVCPHKLCSFIVYGTRKCVHWGGVQRILLFVGRTGVPDVYFY